jgi:hypothetical protein
VGMMYRSFDLSDYIDFKPMPGYVSFVRLEEEGEVSLEPSPGMLILQGDEVPDIIPGEWCNSHVDIPGSSWTVGPEHHISRYRDSKWKLHSINAGKRRKVKTGGYRQDFNIVMTFTNTTTFRKPFSESGLVVVRFDENGKVDEMVEYNQIPTSIYTEIENRWLIGALENTTEGMTHD